jgi:5-formyltetrahydrofolate cyclo-ligase
MQALPAGDISMAQQKNHLRQLLRRRRSAIGKPQRRHCERQAARHLLRWRLLRQARHIAVYLSARSELATGLLIQQLLRGGRRVWVPAVGRYGSMRFVPLRAGSRLRRGPFGLLQPVCRRPCRAARRMDLIVLPLLGFDDHGRRLGNGGGYYDRSLAGLHRGPRPLLLGYAYAAQELAEIPAEPWDVQLDAVITERGLRRIG